MKIAPIALGAKGGCVSRLPLFIAGFGYPRHAGVGRIDVEIADLQRRPDGLATILEETILEELRKVGEWIKEQPKQAAGIPAAPVWRRSS